MYLSHKYKFLFLRTPKTASSSLSEFFIKNIPDENAIYTPVADSNIPGTLDEGYIKKYEETWRYCHFTLQDLFDEGIITQEQIETYRCVAVLRNPVDRQKSFYYFYRQWKSKYKPDTLDDYKRLAPNGVFINESNSEIQQTEFLTFDGKIIGEYWLYENLSDELNQFMSEINTPIIHPLPKHKSNFRKKRSDEIEFDKECIKKITEIFNDDFELYHKMKKSKYASNQSLYS